MIGLRPLSLLSFVIVLGGSFLYCFSSIILPASGVSSSSPSLLSLTAVNTTNATTNTNVTLDQVPVLNSKGVALNSLGKYNESIVYFDKVLDAGSCAFLATIIACSKLVLTKPGSNKITRIPNGSNSYAIDSLRPSTANMVLIC